MQLYGGECNATTLESNVMHFRICCMCHMYLSLNINSDKILTDFLILILLSVFWYPCLFLSFFFLSFLVSLFFLSIYCSFWPIFFFFFLLLSQSASVQVHWLLVFFAMAFVLFAANCWADSLASQAYMQAWKLVVGWYGRLEEGGRKQCS